jgi:hypothetical protein
VSGCLCITAATHSHVFCCVVENKTVFSVICASHSFVTILCGESKIQPYFCGLNYCVWEEKFLSLEYDMCFLIMLDNCGFIF